MAVPRALLSFSPGKLGQATAIGARLRRAMWGLLQGRVSQRMPEPCSFLLMLHPLTTG